MTPSHDPSRTPLHGGAWDPTQPNTPARNDDFDYNFDTSTPSPGVSHARPFCAEWAVMSRMPFNLRESQGGLRWELLAAENRLNCLLVEVCALNRVLCIDCSQIYLSVSFLFRFMEHQTQLLPGVTEDRILLIPLGEGCMARSPVTLPTHSPHPRRVLATLWHREV